MKKSILILLGNLVLCSATSADQLTFRADMVPIFQKRCLLCHQPGGLLPDWTNYETAYQLRNQLAYHVAVYKDMPMNNITGMTDEERNMVATWVEQGAPEGNPVPVTAGTE